MYITDDQVSRYYYPDKDITDRRNYFLVEDGDGNYYWEDLTIESEDSRASAQDVTFYLYTLQNPNNPEVIPATNFPALVNSAVFSTARQNVFVTHGWNNNFLSNVNVQIRTALLNWHNVNIFIVDWSRPANLFYTSARNAVPEIGNAVGDFINTMISSFGLSPARFDLVGHSLGAHVSGCAGARVNGLVNSIVGLDPAGPLFTIGNIDNRIDPTDGDFVQIIHTNDGLLGFSGQLGHADYSPNGGSSQPGCGIDLAGTCAHSRAFLFYAESLGNNALVARQCASHSNFNNGLCNNNHRSLMGGLNVDKR